MRVSPATAAPLRVGLIGCGFATRQHHLPALDGVPELRVVALADSERAALARAAAGRDVHAHADAMPVLVDPGVDVVGICTPPDSHAELAVAALQAGKHVLVEKPLAVTRADAARVLKAAAAGSGLATVGLVYRWHRLNRAVRDLVAAGRVGNVAALHTVATSYTGGAPERAAPWRNDPAAGGGVLYELGTHQVDLWRFLLAGEVVSVNAAASADAAVLAGRMSDGTPVSTTLGFVTGDNHEVVAYGTKGTLTARGDRYDGLDLVPAGRLPGDVGMRLRHGVRLARELPGAVRSRRRGGDLAEAFRAQWRAFAAAIRGDEALAVTLEDGARALELVLAASASAAAHADRPVPEPVA